MSGVTLILSAPAPERLRAALMIATASAALGDPARLFLGETAVALLAAPLADPRDATFAANGLPTLAMLYEDALDAGVALVACQSGLALCGLDASALDARIETGGLVGLLAADRAARIVAL